MDPDLRRRLESFLRPLFQDLDGTSRYDAVERIARIAHVLYAPATPEEAHDFELLLLFHGLEKWLGRMGSISRTVLAVPGIDEADLRRVAASVRRLDAPLLDAERAVAAAILIDSAGLRGLADRFAGARRDGNSLPDVLRAALAEGSSPEWLPPAAESWLRARRTSRREVCRRMLEELDLDDRPR